MTEKKRKVKRNDKKAQIHSQVFIYILTILLVSVILVYGYNSIRNFKTKTDQISCIKFRNDLKNTIDSLTGEFGSSKIKETLACSGTSVCFVETYNEPELPQNVDPIIKDSILSGTGKNVFIIEKIAKESFYIGNISTEPDVLCISPISGKLKIKMESFGDHVVLSRP